MADETLANLMAFLERYHGTEVTWGTDDCSALCAAWARECGYDVHIPAYSSQEEAHRLTSQAGGLVPLWDRICTSAGVPERVGAPQVGDVGIIPTDRFGPVGVIFASEGLCCWRLSKSAFWLSPRRYEKVWAIT
ncbi:DUF6950 family protein [Nitratireductor sp. GCM10026969]|uniref:DUF6950 family protein n=1 Tax=Nitratireductor sp. GCM10026969 TaxID=3252645 RepID=UPI0036081437